MAASDTSLANFHQTPSAILGSLPRLILLQYYSVDLFFNKISSSKLLGSPTHISLSFPSNIYFHELIAVLSNVPFLVHKWQYIDTEA